MRIIGDFDGPDGCGKSTLLAGARQYLAERGISVHVGPRLGAFLPASGGENAFREWVHRNDGLAIAAALLDAGTRRLASVLETALEGDHVLLIDRGSLTVRLSAIAHGMGCQLSEQQACAALAGPLQALAALEKEAASVVLTRNVVVMPRLGMRTIERRLAEREVVNDRYYRYLTVLHDQFKAHVHDRTRVIDAEGVLPESINFAGELLRS